MNIPAADSMPLDDCCKSLGDIKLGVDIDSSPICGVYSLNCLAVGFWFGSTFSSDDATGCG